MNGQELFTKISEMLEKFGIKEALKNPQVVETIYDVMSKHGMKVDKNLFNIVVMGFAVTPTDKLGSLIGMLIGTLLDLLQTFPLHLPNAKRDISIL